MSYVDDQAAEDNRDTSDCSSLTALPSEPSGISLHSASSSERSVDEDQEEHEEASSDSAPVWIVDDDAEIEYEEDDDADDEDESEASFTTSGTSPSTSTPAPSPASSQLSAYSLRRRGRAPLTSTGPRRSARLQEIARHRAQRCADWKRRMAELAHSSSEDGLSVYTVPDSSDQELAAALARIAEADALSQADTKGKAPQRDAFVEFEHDGLTKRATIEGDVFVKHATGWLRESSLHHKRLMISVAASSGASSSRVTLEDLSPSSAAQNLAASSATINSAPTLNTYAADGAGVQAVGSFSAQSDPRPSRQAALTVSLSSHPFPALLLYESD